MWEERVKQQNEDLKTDKVREDLKVTLTNKEYINLKLMAFKAGFKNEGDLLASFVGDLTGWQSNGSDERYLAAQWYDRAFGMWMGYFRHHLFNYDYDLDRMQDMIDDNDFFDQVYEEYKSESYGKELESKEDCMKLLKDIIDGGKEL